MSHTGWMSKCLPMSRVLPTSATLLMGLLQPLTQNTNTKYKYRKESYLESFLAQDKGASEKTEE